MYKYASAGTDAAGAVGTSILSNLVNLPIDPSLVGEVHGIIEGDPGTAGIKGMNKRPALSIIPGVGHSRLARRLQRSYSDAGVDSPKLKAAGVITNRRLTPMLLGIAGALAGGLAGNIYYRKTGKPIQLPDGMQLAPETAGALAGGILGVASGSLVNMICGVAGALSNKKSKEDTREDSGYKLLVPGYGAYEYTNQTIAD